MHYTGICINVCVLLFYSKNKIKSDDVIGDNSVDEKSAMIKNESSAMGDNYDDKYNGDDDDDDESTCCCCFRLVQYSIPSFICTLVYWK